MPGPAHHPVERAGSLRRERRVAAPKATGSSAVGPTHGQPDADAPPLLAWDLAEIGLIAPPAVLHRAVIDADTEHADGAHTTPQELASARAAADLRTDASADITARAFGADAVTVGSVVRLRQGALAGASATRQALIAHELSHVAGHLRTGSDRPFLRVAGDPLQVQFTPVDAQALTDDELHQLLAQLRRHLSSQSDPAASENLTLLETEAARRSVAPPRQASPTATRASDEEQRIRSMNGTDKLAEAIRRAPFTAAVRQKLDSLITPEALSIAILAFVGMFLVAQLTPVGWAADIALVLTAAFVASALHAAIGHLVRFADAVNATTPEQLDIAGGEFAAAVAGIGVDALIFLVTHRLAGGGTAGSPPPSAPATAVQLALRSDGSAVAVIASTVPATISAETALTLGSQAASTGAVLMSVSGGGGGGPRGTSGGGSGSRSRTPEPEAPPRRPAGRSPSPPAAELGFIAALKQRFPRLAELDIRPRRRPSTSGYTATSEAPPEVGAQPSRYREHSGAPEFAFEERMRTSQGGHSYAVYGRDGRVVVEVDGFSVEGWIEHVKIEQQLSRVDEIVTQLRFEAEFARDYGLPGVHYSIAPPAVADAVEAEVARQRIINAFRVE